MLIASVSVGCCCVSITYKYNFERVHMQGAEQVYFNAFTFPFEDERAQTTFVGEADSDVGFVVMILPFIPIAYLVGYG